MSSRLTFKERLANHVCRLLGVNLIWFDDRVVIGYGGSGGMRIRINGAGGGGGSGKSSKIECEFSLEEIARFSFS